MPSSFPPDESSFSENNGHPPQDPLSNPTLNGASRQRGVPEDSGALPASGGRLASTRSGKSDVPEALPIMEDQGERFDRARNSALKVYVVLVVAGILIGIVSLFGIFLFMQHFGLTDVPVRVEQN